MLVLGLTGSIGMGKSTTAGVFRSFGVPVHDADAVVRYLLSQDRRTILDIKAAFPGAAKNATIDRNALGDSVFENRKALEYLEAILHPRVYAAERVFLRQCGRRRLSIAVLDIPLLFETESDRRCDAVVVVSAPSWVQRRRVLSRAGMTEAKFQGILSRQMTDAEKRRRADFVVRTGLGRSFSRRQVRVILDGLTRAIPAPGDRTRGSCSGMGLS